MGGNTQAPTTSGTATTGQLPVLDEEFELVAGQATWVPAGVPHCFRNRGAGTMTIYWVYGGRDVTRTITATGETFEHLSDSDRGAGPVRQSDSATPA